MSDREDPRKTAHVVAKATAEASWPQTRAILRIIFITLLVAAALWVLIKLTGVILLLVLSIFFAYLVSPLVEFIRQPIKLGTRHLVMPRVLAIMAAYLLIFGTITAGIYLLVPRLGDQFPQFTQQARDYWRAIGTDTDRVIEFFRLHRMPGPVVEAINNAVPRIVERVSEHVSAIVANLVSWLIYIPWLIVIPILSFFLLKDAEFFRRSALQMLPKGRWRWRGDEFFQDVSTTLAAYIRAQLIACLFIGVSCALGFTLLGVPSPLVLGLLAGVFEFVPLMGPLLIALIASILMSFHGGFFSAFLLLLFLGLLRIVQDYFVYPRLIGHGIHLHPFAVILAILSGAELAGVAGIFLAIPLVAILTVSYRHWLEHRGSEGFADLLEPAPAGTNPLSDERIPNISTTPEQMERVRPDLTTGELNLPIKD